MKILLLAIGNELLDGRIQNSNALYFSETLKKLGCPAQEIRAIGDNPEKIVDCLNKVAKEFDLVISTGGLGPTNDDITIACLAKATKDPLVEHPKAKESILKYLSSREIEPTKSRLQMAWAPQSAQIISNKVGTAPGVQYLWNGCSFYFLPGVPRECRFIFDSVIVPQIRKKLGASHQMIVASIWRLFGLKEADALAKLKPVIREIEDHYSTSVSLNFQIPWPLVDIRLEVWKSKDTPPKQKIQNWNQEITKRLGVSVFSTDFEPMAASLLRMLRQQKKTLATAESCTGGMVGKLLTDIPGSSDVYLGGAVSYANAAKEELLGVPTSILRRYGAVSKETVQAMAQGIKDRLGASIGIALSGVSGPEGGTERNPVGSIYVGFADANGTAFVHQVVKDSKPDRERHRSFASHLAMNMVRMRGLSEK